MEKTEVIVDTCFLQKLSSEGKVIDNIKAPAQTGAFFLRITGAEPLSTGAWNTGAWRGYAAKARLQEAHGESSR